MIRGLQNKTGGVKIVVMFCSSAGLRFHPGSKMKRQNFHIDFIAYFLLPINIRDSPLLFDLAEKHCKPVTAPQ